MATRNRLLRRRERVHPTSRTRCTRHRPRGGALPYRDTARRPACPPWRNSGSICRLVAEMKCTVRVRWNGQIGTARQTGTRSAASSGCRGATVSSQRVRRSRRDNGARSVVLRVRRVSRRPSAGSTRMSRTACSANGTFARKQSHCQRTSQAERSCFYQAKRAPRAERLPSHRQPRNRLQRRHASHSARRKLGDSLKLLGAIETALILKVGLRSETSELMPSRRFAGSLDRLVPRPVQSSPLPPRTENGECDQSARPD